MRSALTGLEGVKSAEVDLPDKADVTYDKTKTTPKKMIAAIKKAGYGASEKKEKKK